LPLYQILAKVMGIFSNLSIYPEILSTT